ncbi:MAG: hypothetical protein AAFV32_07815, partial [Myxococcota bacterium]
MGGRSGIDLVVFTERAVGVRARGLKARRARGTISLIAGVSVCGESSALLGETCIQTRSMG